jgi:hypothetical protein
MPRLDLRIRIVWNYTAMHRRARLSSSVRDDCGEVAYRSVKMRIPSTVELVIRGSRRMGTTRTIDRNTVGLQCLVSR